MSEMARRMADEASAQMAVAHELRLLREQEAASGYVPQFKLRMGTITARDPSTYTVSVLLGAADQSDFPGGPIPGIRIVDTAYPEIGGRAMVGLLGPEPTVLFTLSGGVGRVRLRKSGAGALVSGVQSAMDFDLEDHDTDDFHVISPATDITVPWPGCYRLEACGAFDANATGRRIISIQHRPVFGSPAYVARHELQGQSSTGFPTLSCSTTMDLAYGDKVQMHAYQSSGGPLNVLADQGYSPVLCATWVSAPETVAP